MKKIVKKIVSYFINKMVKNAHILNLVAKDERVINKIVQNSQRISKTTDVPQCGNISLA